MPAALPRPGILFFCHGARQASWREPFDDIVKRFEALRPEVPAALAFLELMKPDMLQATQTLVEQGVTDVTVIPLFLAPGGHTRHDLPELIEQIQGRWPALSVRVLPTLTESESIRATIVTSALAALERP